MIRTSEQPAFPASQSNFNKDEAGLTKREYFAAMAMQGLLSGRNIEGYNRPSEFAELSVQFADELIKQLKTQTP